MGIKFRASNSAYTSSICVSSDGEMPDEKLLCKPVRVANARPKRRHGTI